MRILLYPQAHGCFLCAVLTDKAPVFLFIFLNTDSAYVRWIVLSSVCVTLGGLFICSQEVTDNLVGHIQ